MKIDTALSGLEDTIAAKFLVFVCTINKAKLKQYQELQKR